MKEKTNQRFWTDDELLFALDASVSLGWSAKEISAGLRRAFGSVRSRMSVIGALNRIWADDAAAHGVSQ